MMVFETAIRRVLLLDFGAPAGVAVALLVVGFVTWLLYNQRRSDGAFPARLARQRSRAVGGGYCRQLATQVQRSGVAINSLIGGACALARRVHLAESLERTCLLVPVARLPQDRCIILEHRNGSRCLAERVQTLCPPAAHPRNVRWGRGRSRKGRRAQDA